MLKKILAASTAGVLALTALASTAMAADDNTIVFENVVENETVTLELTNELTADNIKSLLGNASTADVADGWDDSKNSYSNIVLSAWIKEISGNTAATGVQGVGKDGKATGVWYNFNSSKKDITFGGATVDVKLQGSMKEYVVIRAGSTVPADAPVSSGLTPGATLEADTLLPKGTKGGAAGFNTAFTAADAANGVKGNQAKDWTKELTIAKDTAWLDSKISATVNGFATSPVAANASFGASATNQLQSIDYGKSSVKMSFTVSMPADMFRGMVTKISGNTWDWSGATWNSALINEILNSQAGKDTINNYFGIVGESGTVSGGTFTSKGGVSSNNQTKVTKADYETTSSKKALPNWGKATIGLGINATPTRLKNLNNGGTITFEFNKDMWNGVFADVEVIFRAASGQVKYPLATDYKWSEDGKSISVPLPAGLTYNEQLNSFNSFSMEYKVGVTHSGDLVDLGNGDNIGQWWGNNPTFWDANVTKITISANKEAPKPDDSNSGGLVSSDSTSTSTPSSSSNTNSGSNNGEKNPGTGVAVAVAPVVLAAAGAAVVISKKRK